MKIIIDSRQKADKHTLKDAYFKSHQIDSYRCKLPFGDYSALNKVYVDSKANMAEIAQNIGGGTREHNRFRNELILAKSFGKHLYILVENSEGIAKLSQVQYWQNPRRFESPNCITGLRLCKAMDTMQTKYGCSFVFCTPEQAGEAIIRLLERDE